MNYVALLRGVNVGGKRKVEMSQLKELFVSLGCKNVETYLNSGNAIFESKTSQEELQEVIPDELANMLGFNVRVLIKNRLQMKNIANSIPVYWVNNSEQKSDVAYLFPEIDSRDIIDELPIKKEFIDLRYVDGALLWSVERKKYNKSHLNKIIGTRLYQLMTIRNVNTARYLAKK